MQNQPVDPRLLDSGLQKVHFGLPRPGNRRDDPYAESQLDSRSSPSSVLVHSPQTPQACGEIWDIFFIFTGLELLLSHGPQYAVL